MDALLSQLAEKYSLKTGSSCIFGKHSGQVFGIYKNENSKYTAIMMVNEEKRSEVESRLPEINKDKKDALEFNNDHLILSEVKKKSFADIFDGFLNELSQIHQIDSGETSSRKPILINGMIDYKSPNEIMTLRHEFDRDRKKVLDIRPNYLLGSLFGLAGSLSGAGIWWFLEYVAERIFLLTPIITGILVAKLYEFFAKRVDVLGLIIISFLTLLGTYLAKIAVVASYVYENIGEIAILQSVEVYNQHIVENGIGEEVISYLFAIIGTGIVVYQLWKEKNITLDIEES